MAGPPPRHHARDAAGGGAPDHQAEPAPAVIQRTEAHLGHHAPAELAAELVYDSRRDLSIAGLQATDDADPTVHLAYCAAGVDLVIDIRRSGGHDCVLDGQAFVDGWGSDAPVFEATACGRGWSARTVDGDSLGRFRLEHLPVENLELRVTNGELLLTAAVDLQRGAP